MWGIPALIMILGVGLYLSMRTGFAQFRLFPAAIRNFCRQFSKNKDKSTVSAYQALCTALAATVGTGNIVGVAGAIVLGGPGAIFWMWVCAILGMVTKFAEATLAVRYRQKNRNGEFVGGPMYMIRQGLGADKNYLAAAYCVLGIVASLGVGNATQVNAVLIGVNTLLTQFGLCGGRSINLLIGIALAFLVAAVLLGGAKRIGNAAEKLVPFASVAYILLCGTVLSLRVRHIPDAVCSIVKGAFSPRSVTGGVLGSAFVSLRVGASRGTFTNEAGMGTASIAHAGANVRDPVEQGYMGIIEVFLDTIVICTMTALVILCSGIRIPYGTAAGNNLTNDAFRLVVGDWVSVPLAIALCCFAVATIFGWSLYGGRCAQYLFGDRAWKYYAAIQSVTVVAGSVISAQSAWLLAEIFNGLMAIPNLIALVCLSPELCRLLKITNHFS